MTTECVTMPTYNLVFTDEETTSIKNTVSILNDILHTMKVYRCPTLTTFLSDDIDKDDIHHLMTLLISLKADKHQLINRGDNND